MGGKFHCNTITNFTKLLSTHIYNWYRCHGIGKYFIRTCRVLNVHKLLQTCRHHWRLPGLSASLRIRSNRKDSTANKHFWGGGKTAIPLNQLIRSTKQLFFLRQFYNSALGPRTLTSEASWSDLTRWLRPLHSEEPHQRAISVALANSPPAPPRWRALQDAWYLNVRSRRRRDN